MRFGFRLLRSILLCGFCAGLLLPATRAAAAPPQQAPAADPGLDAAKTDFEALSEAERVAIQDGLIWTGDYKGIADGKFGKGTRDAIVAFATRNKFPADGTLDAKGRAALAATAKQAKDAMRFLVQTDAKTGQRIGLPLKLLTKSKPIATGTRYSSADESFSVETRTTSAGLQEAFTAISIERPGRKVTYKVLRPDFFVVAGEADGSVFYTRMAARGEHLTGFSLAYPAAAKARFDPVSIAIANSFVPFPDAAASPAGPAATPNPAAAQPGPAESAAPRPVLTASGVIVGPGLVLTSLPASCADPLIGTKKARITKRGETDGLTLLSFAEAGATTLALRGDDLTSPAQITVLSFAPRLPSGEDLVGASGDMHKGEAAGSWRLLAPLQNPVAGAVVLDRSGALAGLVPAEASPGKAVAGILPQANREVIPAVKLAGFLAEARPRSAAPGEARTTGEIAALGRAALVAVSCLR